MRRPVKNRNIVGPDLKYSSTKVEKFINYIMKWGQKSTARRVVYQAFDEIKEKTKREPLEVFEEALRNVGPAMEVRPERKTALTYRWIIDAARARKGAPMHKRLAEELIAASKNEGPAVKKREDTHKMAEANKAFAHFAW